MASQYIRNQYLTDFVAWLFEALFHRPCSPSVHISKLVVRKLQPAPQVLPKQHPSAAAHPTIHLTFFPKELPSFILVIYFNSPFLVDH
jgi:hypothetical protein